MHKDYYIDVKYVYFAVATVHVGHGWMLHDKSTQYGLLRIMEQVLYLTTSMCAECVIGGELLNETSSHLCIVVIPRTMKEIIYSQIWTSAKVSCTRKGTLLTG